MSQEFTITSFDWNLKIAEKLRKAGCPAEDEETILASLSALAEFLEGKQLVKHKLLRNGSLIEGRSFALRSTDLTDLGLKVIRGGFGSWEKMGCPATDLKPLEKAYLKIISEPGGRRN